MRNQLRGLLLLCVPVGFAGCALLDKSRASKRGKPEVICGPQIAANYTVPQWGVLPATPAACCLPVGAVHGQYSTVESVPNPQPTATSTYGVETGGLTSDPHAFTPGLLESPVVIPNRNRMPVVSKPPLPAITAEPAQAEPSRSIQSPSDAGVPPTFVPNGDIQPHLPASAPPPPPGPATDQVQQGSDASALRDLPQIQLPDVDQPGATSWGDADLPSVPQVADEELFRYVF